MDGTGTGFCLLKAMVGFPGPLRAGPGQALSGGGTRPRTRKYFDPQLDFVRYW